MSSIQSLRVPDSLSVQVAVTASFFFKNCNSIPNLIMKDYFSSDVPVYFNKNRPCIALKGLWDIPGKIRKGKQGERRGLIIFASLHYHIYCIPTWNRGAVKAARGSRHIARYEQSLEALLKTRHALASSCVVKAWSCLSVEQARCLRQCLCVRTQAGFVGPVVY